MGTRNLTCVISDGQFKIAQYGQWDGYPTGAGATILKFLLKNDVNAFRERLKRVAFISDAELDRRVTEAGFGESMTMDVYDRYKSEFPWFCRDLGAGILQRLMDNMHDKVDLQDSREFAHDSLFCEWAYVVDLDRLVLEVYAGFNKDASANSGVFTNKMGKEYATVALVKSYPLDNLPTVDQLDEECNPSEDEDE